MVGSARLMSDIVLPSGQQHAELVVDDGIRALGRVRGVAAVPVDHLHRESHLVAAPVGTRNPSMRTVERSA